ncbi:hypothetical protein [Paenibacillus sp. FSL K6-2524]|uniref:hypothetical protein n=1 Tax=Paenibacillus sp. FSL K6-2524 TaxID=2954516 RepID=UPI0030F68426
MDRKNVLALWKKVSTCIADEITNNDEFANRMGLIFEANLVTTDSSDNETADTKPKRGKRREPAKVNPFVLLERGADFLMTALEALNIEELKDVIAENGMDTAKLAMKWKDRNRLINHIVETTRRRSSRGDAFWNTGSENSTDSE